MSTVYGMEDNLVDHNNYLIHVQHCEPNSSKTFLSSQKEVHLDHENEEATTMCLCRTKETVNHW